MKDHIPGFLLFAFVMFLVGGFGYLIIQDQEQRERYTLACLAAGKSIVGPSCVKVEP